MKTLKKAKYLARIYWSDEDDCYVGQVPTLKGCVSHGKSYADCAKNLQEAMELWLESAHEFSDPIPLPDTIAEEIYRLLPILNLSKLARMAGINKYTLASKLRRKTPFTQKEAEKILRCLELNPV